MLEIFKNRLKIARSTAKVSQSELADRIGSTRSTISGYESDGKEPDFATFIKICEALDTSPSYLLGLEDDGEFSSASPSDPFSAFYRSCEGLPKPQREALIKSLNEFFALLSSDIASKSAEHIDLYASLLSSLSAGRSSIRSQILSSAPTVDVSVVSDVMSQQSTMKNSISASLDELLQADLLAASPSKKSRRVNGRAI